MPLMDHHSSHISRNLDRQLHMFNRQKIPAPQLLVTLQDQLLASQLVVKTLLDEFANIDNIYESYKPTIKSAVWLLKTNSENNLREAIYLSQEMH